MTISTWMHGVTSINLTPITCMENKVTETTFYTRDIVIKTADGESFSFTMFSDDGYKLLIEDTDLDSMQRPAIKKAA